jgi:hypothetical protein
MFGLLACPARADGVLRVGISVPPPPGFRAAPSVVARRHADKLPELLEAAGLEPLGVTRARLALEGSPTEPTATLLTANVRVLTSARGVVPELAPEALAAALSALTPAGGETAAVGPSARTAAGLSGHEIGWTLPLAGGRARMARRLLLPQPGGVLVLALDVREGDEKHWSAVWTRLVRALAPESAPQESGLPLFPALPLALAAAALLTAGLQRMRLAPERPSEAFVAGLERRGRAPLPPALSVAPAVTSSAALPHEEPIDGPPEEAAAAPATEPARVSAPERAPSAPAPAASDAGEDLLGLVRVSDGGSSTSFGQGPSLLELKLARRQQPRPS